MRLQNLLRNTRDSENKMKLTLKKRQNAYTCTIPAVKRTLRKNLNWRESATRDVTENRQFTDLLWLYFNLRDLTSYENF